MAYSSWSVSFNEQPSAAKWNILGTNDAYFDSLIGSGTAWTSWTPTLTNLSGGTLTYAKYCQIGKTVHWRFKYTMAGANVSGLVNITAPVTMSSDYGAGSSNAEPLGVAIFLDVGSALYQGVVLPTSDGKLNIRVSGSAGTYANPGDISATVPFTWGNTDILSAAGTYEAA